jgi:predicted alpha/beta-fold hydrolase
LTSEAHGQRRASSFQPHPLLRNRQLQTLLPALLRPPPAVVLRIERLELPDGDFVDLGWTGEMHRAGPIAVLVHGLSGGLDSKYLLGTARRLSQLGWRVAGLQLRGAGAEPNRLPRAYHHGDTADLRHFLRLLRAREPQTLIAAIGWSLGGNVVLKTMGEEGERASADLACAASVPFRLHECAEHLRHGFARVYQNHLLGRLKQMVRAKHARTPIPAPADFERTLAARDFFEYDNAFTAPLNGFRDAEDYYARAACGRYLKLIRRPVLIVHALDDPFMTADIVPSASELPPDVSLELSERGGHVGFIGANRRGGPRWWLEERLTEWLEEQRTARGEATDGHPLARTG